MSFNQRRSEFRSEGVPRFAISLLMLLSLLSGFGCDRYLKDQRPKHKPFELNFEGVQCMNQVPTVLNQYFQQHLEKEKLHETVDCVDKALGEFLRSTKGVESSSYQAAEVQRFFQKYIFKREISEELGREIMKLKAAMIGGTDEVITRMEFEKLRELLKVIEAEMLRLYPHLNVYLLREPVSVMSVEQRSRLDLAIADLRLSVQNLLAELHLAESDYSLPEIDLLMAEVEKFAGITDPQHPFSLWRQRLPTLEKLKSILVGDVVSMRSQKEIFEIWNMLIDVYRLGLQYQGGIDRLDWSVPANFSEFDAWMEDSISVLIRALNLRNKGQIPYAKLDEMVDELKVRGLWIEHLEPTTAKLTYRQFIARFLDHSSEELMALEVRHLMNLRREYRGFKLVQSALSKVFAEKPRRPRSEVIVVLENYPALKDIERLSPLSPQDQQYFSQVWEEFLMLVKDSAVHHWDARGRVSVTLQKMDLWRYTELTQMNLLRLPTSLMFRAYGERYDNPRESALTTAQISLVFTEFQKIGNELKLFDGRTANKAQRCVREADMFTPWGNGDARVQFTELFDLISVLWSGGIVGVSEIKHFAEEDGCLIKEKSDYFRKPYLQMECAGRSLRKRIPQILPNLPRFGQYIQGLSNETWTTFFADWLKVSRVCPNDTVGLETGDQQTMVVVLHYIENLFSVYDVNKNNLLEDSEVEQAFPRFQQFMTDVTHKRVQAQSPTLYSMTKNWDWSTMTLNVFKFIVFTGRTPASDDLGITDFFSVTHWDRSADRLGILKVFANLKSEISTPSVSCETSH